MSFGSGFLPFLQLLVTLPAPSLVSLELRSFQVNCMIIFSRLQPLSTFVIESNINFGGALLYQ